MAKVEQFFTDIDRVWRLDGKVVLQIFGSGALLLQTDYERGTKDSDVFETQELLRAHVDHLREIAGPKTALALRHGIYVEIVPNGIPFFPRPTNWNPLEELNRKLEHPEVWALDVTDVVVSKLKPFRPIDMEDIDAISGAGL